MELTLNTLAVSKDLSVLIFDCDGESVALNKSQVKVLHAFIEAYLEQM